MLKNHSLKTKILSICLLLAAIVGVAGGVCYYAMTSVATNYSHVATINLPNSYLLAEMRGEYRNARIALRTLGMEGLTPELEDKARAAVLEAFEKYEAADKRYNEVPFVDGEQPLYEALSGAWKTYKAEALSIIEISKKHTAESRQQMQTFFYKTAVANNQRFNAAMEALLSFQLKESDKWVKLAQTAETRGFWLALGATLLGFVIAVVAGVTFSGSLASALRAIAGSLSEGADEVAAAAAEISSTSVSLSSGATEQAAAIQETASSIEEMSAMVKKNADNAGRSQAVAQESQGAAAEGKQVVAQMITAIGEISDSNARIMRQIEDSNREIAEITKVIGEIGNKTKVINDIVFQTKLLSFNASVEAARAGENGKGFAVVAEEVGNLAQMSGNAAKEISVMLDESIRKVEDIVHRTQTSVEQLVAVGRQKVDTGAKVAQRCGDVLEDLVRNVTQVAQMVGEITTASSEQAQGVQEITKAMSQLDQVTQQNASASHEAASASEQLARQAETLRASVKDLLAAVNGPAASDTEAAVSSHRASRLPGKSAVASAGPELPSGSDARFEETRQAG